MEHFVVIKFGADPDSSEESFEFDSEAELDAFMMGVAVACGWSDYELLRTSDDKRT